MSLAIINKFDGGQSEDVRTFAVNQHDSSSNFNVYTSPHLLVPYIDTITETVSSGTLTDFFFTDVDVISVSGATLFVALGEAGGGSTALRFWKKGSSSDITSAWEGGGTGLVSKVSGSLVVYKGLAYALGSNGTQHSLQRYDGNVTVTNIGTLTGFGNPPAKSFVHPEDNKLYMGSANVISTYDGTTFVATALTLPDDKVIVSLTNYGSYLVIACRPRYGYGNSICYLWGRDTTLNTLQAVIDLGFGQVNIAENLNNTLFFVMSKSAIGNYSNILQNTLSVKGYAGGSVEVIKEINISSSFGTSLNVLKQKVNEHLYFGFSNDTALYRFGKNKSGEYFLSHDRAYPTGATILAGFSLIGDFMWFCGTVSGTANSFRRTRALSESQEFTRVSTYVTTINPSMIIEDRYKFKQLQSVQVAYTGGTLVSVQVSYDGGSYQTVLSSSSTGEQVLEATAQNSDGAPLGEGREFQFRIESTGSAKVKEVRYFYKDINTQMK